LWLIKVWFSASTFVVKIATFAKPENVIGNSEVNHQKDKMQHHYWVIAQIPQLKSFDMSKIFCNHCRPIKIKNIS
jgi:hypothetical protein